MKNIYDLVIIGAGPSALTAAIYAAREDMKTLVLERSVVGGLTATIDNIENMPGYPDGVTGMDFANSLEKQATKFGAEIEYAEATGIFREKNEIKIETDDEPVFAKSVLLAVGNSYRHIGVPGEDEFAHYCATCDGAFYRGKKIATVGGGNTAVQEAIFLTKFATHVDMIVRSHIKADAILVRELDEKVAEGKITVHENWTPTKMSADGLFAKNNESGEEKLFAADGVFVFAGVIPNTEFLRGVINLDPVGHILSDEKLSTNMPGVFVSGDVRAGANEQIVSAAGEGATVALHIREFLHGAK